jgi:sugar O-acyltransferase (sialic acid O-acetyltransferase NeuD family)
MTALLLIGGGGHCHSCIDVIETSRAYSVAGIVERQAATDAHANVLSYPVLGGDDDLPELITEYPAVLITIGQVKSAERRISLFERLKTLQAVFPSVISPHAYISRHATLGAGTIVMHGVILNAAARVGENCIINSQALIEHDCVVESHCHISTGAKLNGNVHIGTGSFVGSGVVVREGVRIGANCLIPAGAIVFRDVPAGSFYRGTHG